MDPKICKYYCYRNTRSLKNINYDKLDKIKLVVFDMDGVLVDAVSSWKYVHDFFKVNNDKSVDDYVHGKIDDLEFIQRDVELWKIDGKPIKMDFLKEILSDAPLMKGAEECIVSLKKKGVKIAIVSAGLDTLAKHVASKLDINYVYANGLKTDEQGYLNGEGILGVKLMYKDQAVENISEKLNIPLCCIASVGNSCFDIPMFDVSGVGIAFNSEDDCTRESADYVVEGKDLSDILPCLKEYI